MRIPVMTPATRSGGRRPQTLEPATGPVALRPNADHLDVDAKTVRAVDTLATGRRRLDGLSADDRSPPMTRGELLTLVTAFRDERGRVHDTAAHRLLTEVACHLEWDVADARAGLLARVEALRDERARSQDAVLMLLLGEIVTALDGGPRTAPGPSVGFCEFCGSGGGCAVCGGD
jgi:hypothetical protein